MRIGLLITLYIIIIIIVIIIIYIYIWVILAICRLYIGYIYDIYWL